MIFALYFTEANAQATSLNENFNTSCSSGSGAFPTDWAYYNPISGTTPMGQWQCSSTDGRWGTPGIECTGIWGSPAADNLDTSYLVSPALNLSSYAGNVYLNFDSKTSRIYLGGRISILASTDSNFQTGVYDLTDSVSPIFTEDDSSGWVTHQANLAPYKSMVPLYLAFLYTSTTATGSIWYLDNIQTTTFILSVSGPTENTLPLTVIGNSTTSQITLSYKTETAGIYHLIIYDAVGHKAYEEDISSAAGIATYAISGLHLHSGMYLIKMGNGLTYGTTKTIVP